ncbi:hypothetical protein P3X46_031176 [Hevea brasiliensis]|uniref:AIPP2-like SPOC-like domain-containing protein n=1 Tax=Hevea brasiliensis TaxID=3981 RepID=A0ABQ9KL08_HEVBR|nr:hypothetical protein P3X46_031176 [Hevea brasiliensis]
MKDHERGRATKCVGDAVRLRSRDWVWQVEHCAACGDVGFQEVAVTCDCFNARENEYCTHYNSLAIPEIWFCEKCCNSDHLGLPEFSPRGTSFDSLCSSPIGVAIHGNKEIPSGQEEPTHAGDDAFSYGKAKQVINGISTVKSHCPTKFSGKKAEQASNETSCPSFSIKTPSFSLNHSGNEAEKTTDGRLSLNSLTDKPTQLPKSSGMKAEQATYEGLWSFFLPPEPLSFTHDGKKAEEAIKDGVSLSSLTTKPPPPPRHSRKKLSGEKHYLDDEPKTSDIQAKPVKYNLLQFEKYPSNHPKLEAVWNGSFGVLDTVFPGNGCFRAHLPQCPWIIDSRAYQVAKQMPKVLQFELRPRCNIWAEIFKNDFAFGCDISLYFFPGNSERSIQQFGHLWSFIDKEDLVMRTCMNGFELLVFSSKRLRYADELKWISFLWGVFRFAKKEHVSASVSNNKISEAHASGVGTASKQLPRKKTKRFNSLEVPPGFFRKSASEDALEESFDASNLVEVPVRSHPAVSRSAAHWARVARRRRPGKPNKTP